MKRWCRKEPIRAWALGFAGALVLAVVVLSIAFAIQEARTARQIRSIFWKEANAEAMLVLRGLVLSRRWKEVFAKVTESLAYDRRLDWEWQSPDMVGELKAGIAITPPKPQPHSQEACYTTAA